MKNQSGRNNALNGIKNGSGNVRFSEIKIQDSFKDGSRNVRFNGGDTKSGQILQPDGAKKVDDDKINGQVSETEGKMVKLVEEYVDIFEKEALPPMETEPMVITLKENYVPKAMMVPRKVPYARRDQEIKEIRKLEADGIIEPVGDRPTEFCSPTICPVKPDGTLRFATDFTYLNKQVLRTVHPTLSSWDVIHSIDPKAKFFSTFDCKKGY